MSVKTVRYECPWCGHTGPPLNTEAFLGEANFIYGKTAEAIKLNPYMCRECTGVGGREDFVVEEE